MYTGPGNITARVDEFRNALGPSSGGTAGEQPTGRREINWDGAGANPPTYAAEFTSVSPTKIFAPIGSNLVDRLFRVAAIVALEGAGVWLVDRLLSRGADVPMPQSASA